MMRLINMSVTLPWSFVLLLSVVLIPEVKAQKIFIAISGINDLQIQFLQDQENVEQATMIYEAELSSDNSMQLDTLLLKESIHKKIPDSNHSGIAVLDWETPFKILREGQSNAMFTQIEKEYLLALKIAKKERPNVKWAFYGLPFRSFKKTDRKWEQVNEMLRNILTHSDFVSPSLYMYSGKLYDYSGPYQEKGSSDRIEENLVFFLRIAKSLNKNLYPFIWHRSHLNLIPLHRFTNYINLITSIEYEGKTIDGVIWWGHQTYYFRSRGLYENLKSEYKDIENVDAYHLDIMEKYLRMIKDAL